MPQKHTVDLTETSNYEPFSVDTTDAEEHDLTKYELSTTDYEENDIAKDPTETDKPSHSAAAQSRKLYHHLLMQYL